MVAQGVLMLVWLGLFFGTGGEAYNLNPLVAAAGIAGAVGAVLLALSLFRLRQARFTASPADPATGSRATPSGRTLTHAWYAIAGFLAFAQFEVIAAVLYLTSTPVTVANRAASLVFAAPAYLAFLIAWLAFLCAAALTVRLLSRVRRETGWEVPIQGPFILAYALVNAVGYALLAAAVAVGPAGGGPLNSASGLFHVIVAPSLGVIVFFVQFSLASKIKGPPAAEAPLGGAEPRGPSSGPSAQSAEPSSRPGAGSRAPASASPFAATSHPGVVSDAGKDRPTFLVENVFLLYHDGRNMFASGALGVDALEDPELVGAMLVAVQGFIKDSFRTGANVDRMGYGDSSILIERGDHVVLAVTVFGSPPHAFRELMSDMVEKVQGTYAGMVEEWDGNKTALKGVEGLLSPLWVPTLDLTHEDILLATTAREVQVRSGVEFFQGFVRLKVSVVNSTTTVITGASIDLDYDHDALRLHKIEPSTYRTEGAKVNLAVINTGEKKTVAYYFDPQICTSTAIDGACRFKDPEGNIHTVQMKSRKAEVVCPLFFTPEQANTAMLKRLVEEELKLYDVKGYSFKAGMAHGDLHKLFEAVKSTVRAHDVVLVRAFERKEPYVAEAWFYGRTQKRRDAMVIRGVVDSANARVEFYAASGAIRSVTGLLAEFHHTFDAKMKDEFGDFGVQPLFDETLRRGYSDPAVVSGLIEGDEESVPRTGAT